MNGTDYALDPPPYRKFMRVMLAQAGADLVRLRPGNSGNVPEWRRARVSAACWLASKAAAIYFDTAEYEQKNALVQAGWPRVVREILDEHESGAHRLEPGVERHLGRGLKIVEREAVAAVGSQP